MNTLRSAEDTYIDQGKYGDTKNHYGGISPDGLYRVAADDINCRTLHVNAGALKYIKSEKRQVLQRLSSREAVRKCSDANWQINKVTCIQRRITVNKKLGRMWKEAVVDA
jgi:hypothetical protein